MDKLTVLILAAGYGRRMGLLSEMINKSLVPYRQKPLISHIIEKFPVDTKFVIACGFLGYQIKDYLSLVRPDLDVTFVDIIDYNESSTGPGTTIKYCQPYLPENFIWISCDTLFEFDFTDKLDHSWIAVSEVPSEQSSEYSWVNKDNVIINKQSSSEPVNAFIGLMYVHGTEYFRLLNSSTEAIAGISSTTKAYKVNDWKDFGTYSKWKSHDGLSQTLSFVKPNELLYIDNKKVVKFTADQSLAEARFSRASINSKSLPTTIQFKSNFLAYDYMPGDPFYNWLTLDRFNLFLEWASKNIWDVKDTSNSDKTILAENFYHKKTVERLKKFREKYPDWKECETVNSFLVKSIDYYLEHIDLSSLTSSTLWCFIHGDLQFDNLLFDETTNKFTVIDWRTDFAGSAYGDLYYDIAKMLGGLYLNYKAIKNDLLEYNESNSRSRINDLSVENLDQYEQILKNWVDEHNLNWDKVKILVPIIYLNMAPLHEYPMDKYLVSYAQLLFSKL